MSCVVEIGSQLVILQPAAVVMSEIAVEGPHYVCVAQSARVRKSSGGRQKHKRTMWMDPEALELAGMSQEHSP